MDRCFSSTSWEFVSLADYMFSYVDIPMCCLGDGMGFWICCHLWLSSESTVTYCWCLYYAFSTNLSVKYYFRAYVTFSAIWPLTQNIKQLWTWVVCQTIFKKLVWLLSVVENMHDWNTKLHLGNCMGSRTKFSNKLEWKMEKKKCSVWSFWFQDRCFYFGSEVKLLR